MGMPEEQPSGRLSSWWRYAALAIVLAEFTVLGWLAATAYSISSPIPDKVVGPAGQVVFTGADITGADLTGAKSANIDGAVRK